MANDFCMIRYASMLPLKISGDGYWYQTSLNFLEVCCDFGAKLSMLAPLIIWEIRHRGVRICFHVMPFYQRAYCCHATPTIDIIGRMFIHHVCKFVEVGNSGILHDGKWCVMGFQLDVIRLPGIRHHYVPLHFRWSIGIPSLLHPKFCNTAVSANDSLLSSMYCCLKK